MATATGDLSNDVELADIDGEHNVSIYCSRNCSDNVQVH